MRLNTTLKVTTSYLRTVLMVFTVVSLGSSCATGFVSFHNRGIQESKKQSDIPEEGYMRIYISADLSDLSPPGQDGFSFLSITIESPEGYEYPVYSYDYSSSNYSSSLFYNPDGLTYYSTLYESPEPMTLHARAIPENYASIYARSVGKFDHLKDIDTSEVIPDIPELSLAAGLLGGVMSMIEEEGNRVWHSKITLGDRKPGENAPLGDQTSVIFLLTEEQTEGGALDNLNQWEFQKCRSLQGKLCTSSGEVFKDYSYFIIDVSHTDYRPLQASNRLKSCTIPANYQEQIHDSIKQMELTPSQEKSEEKLARYVQAYIEVRDLKSLSIDQLASYSYRMERDTALDRDPYWNRYFAPKYETVSGCFEQNIQDRGLKQRMWYGAIQQAIHASANWELTVKQSNIPEEEKLAILEKTLADLNVPITHFNLSEGELFDFLQYNRSKIESILRVHDENLQYKITMGNMADGEARSLILSRLENTSCESCRMVLESAYAGVRTNMAKASMNATEARIISRQQNVARLETMLAQVRFQAKQTASIARANNPRSPELRALDQSLQQTENMTASNDDSPVILNRYINQIQNQINMTRNQLNTDN